MKVTVTIELDLSENPAVNVTKISELPVCLQNLGMLFQDLAQHHSVNVIEAMASNLKNKKLQAAMVEAARNKLAVSEQIFNNYRIHGVSEDGHEFLFTHEEPGYVERTLIDGK